MKEAIERAIRETLVVENKQSIGRAADKILVLLTPVDVVEQVSKDTLVNAIANKLRKTDVCFAIDCDTVKECSHTGHGCPLWDSTANGIAEMILPFLNTNKNPKADSSATDKNEKP